MEIIMNNIKHLTPPYPGEKQWVNQVKNYYRIKQLGNNDNPYTQILVEDIQDATGKSFYSASKDWKDIADTIVKLLTRPNQNYSVSQPFTGDIVYLLDPWVANIFALSSGILTAFTIYKTARGIMKLVGKLIEWKKLQDKVAQFSSGSAKDQQRMRISEADKFIKMLESYAGTGKDLPDNVANDIYSFFERETENAAEFKKIVQKVSAVTKSYFVSQKQLQFGRELAEAVPRLIANTPIINSTNDVMNVLGENRASFNFLNIGNIMGFVAKDPHWTNVVAMLSPVAVVVGAAASLITPILAAIKIGKTCVQVAHMIDDWIDAYKEKNKYAAGEIAGKEKMRLDYAKQLAEELSSAGEVAIPRNIQSEIINFFKDEQMTAEEFADFSKKVRRLAK